MFEYIYNLTLKPTQRSVAKKVGDLLKKLSEINY